MERKIGEIFEHNGEWYQCIESDSFGECSLRMTECGSGTKSNLADEVFGKCSKIRRSDSKHVVFKKLEKVGESFISGGKLYQHYKVFDIDNIDFTKCTNMNVHNYNKKTLTVEIKQTKEDMEEKTQLPKEDNPLTRLVYNYVNGKISDKELIKSIKEVSDEYPYNKNNLKPFSLEAAKAGKPVCTRDGRKARIICIDAKRTHPIIALVSDPDIEGEEIPFCYTNDGFYNNPNCESNHDLMILPEKKEGWVNVAKEPLGDDEVVLGYIFNSYEDAVRSGKSNERYVATVRIEWEG